MIPIIKGESVTDYVVVVRNLAKHCEYWDTLDTMLSASQAKQKS